ncbi:Sodium/iodide cotransporter [Holothuria leucospilota]|uniref:Sodium/iodide cotransporter n=1 Tax=Holothuria leucospilota TaxID=206669 RepID=A0A9Q1HGX9_HOLLE|nr:Sodium/iodide cotransporter [Holothuria leucospilota]
MQVAIPLHLVTSRRSTKCCLTSSWIFFQNIPGIAGILAICRAALSSMSSGINALSFICHKEVIHIIGKDLTRKQDGIVTKDLTGVTGVLTVLLKFLAPYLGGILDALMTCQGILRGPFLVCLTGMTLSFVLLAILKVGNTVYPKAIFVLPSLSIEKCSAATQIIATENISLTTFLDESPDGFAVWQISTFFYGAFSTYLTIIIGLMMSYITRSSEFTIEERLLWRPSRDKIPVAAETDINEELDYHAENKYQPVKTVTLPECPHTK